MEVCLCVCSSIIQTQLDQLGFFFVCMEMAHICGYNLGILTVLLPSSQYDLPKAAAS